MCIENVAVISYVIVQKQHTQQCLQISISEHISTPLFSILLISSLFYIFNSYLTSS